MRLAGVQGGRQPGTPEIDAERAVRLPRPSLTVRCLLALLGLLLVLWLWLFYAEGAVRGGPNGRAFGGDFAAYYTAAQLMERGKNPFDHTLLYAAESRTLGGQGLPITTVRSVVRVGQPPIFFLAIRPLSRLTFQVAALLWILGVYLLAALGFVASLRYCGLRLRAVPLLIFLLLPQVVLGAFYGNVVGILFAAVSCSLLLTKRYPFIAGMVLSLAWLKPQVGLPILFLIALFHTPSRGRLASGFMAATALMVGVTVLTLPPVTLHWWVSGMTGFSGDMKQQPGLACLSALYVRWAPYSLQRILEVLGAALAMLLTVRQRRREAGMAPMAAVGWLWCLWLLATPYAHFPDEILLAAPVLAALPWRGASQSWARTVTILYLAFFSLPLINWYPGGANLLCLPLLGMAICLAASSPARLGSRSQTGGERKAARGSSGGPTRQQVAG